MIDMVIVLEIIISAVLCLGGVCFFWYSSKKGKWCLIALMVVGYFFASCNEAKKEVSRSDETTRTMTVHDTIYKDTLVVSKHEQVYVDAKWLRRQFEIPVKAYWKNYEDGYGVEYPTFMDRKSDGRDAKRNLRVEYQDISMIITTYDEKYDMSVQEKFEAISQSAVTKVLADNSFTLAGNCGRNRLYFEKDIMLKPRTWIYLRVEFPSELTWAVDPLLHYVKDYQP